MARPVNVHEAKTHLSRLLEAVENGEEVVIARAGRPVARLVAVDAGPHPRGRGIWAGKVTLPDGLDEPDPEIAALFEASEIFPTDPVGVPDTGHDASRS